ncbi:MAG: penicillin-binding protein 2 [Myxococcota bacterium]
MSLLPTQGEGRDYRTRYAASMVAVLLALAALTGRVYQLQVIKGEHYSRLSKSNFVKARTIPADRGMILDRRGAILVDARPSYDVEITPVFATDPDATLEVLSRVLELDAESVDRVKRSMEAARGLDRFVPIRVKRDVGRDALDWLEAHRVDLDGVDVRVRPQRHYRHDSYLAHVLGYMNQIDRQELNEARAAGLDYKLGDMIGRSGLEERFESWLRGKDGIERVVVDSRGRPTRLEAQNELIPEDERVMPSVPGHNVVLSIDIRLQQIAEEAFPGLAGSIVAVDPQTGYILAMLSRPSFDPNRLSGRISRVELRELSENPLEPILNRTIQQHYPPGSTFKVVTALAALDVGAVNGIGHGTTCGGGYRLGRRRWRCWRDAGHGFVALHDSLKHSCDTYYYWVADRMGVNPIAEWARKFGFGRPTGIGLANEIPGIIPDEDWYERRHPDGYQRGLALNAAIGQGDVNATPIQVAMAYAAIANGGVLYKPQLVRRVEDVNGELIEEFLPEETGRVDMEPEVIDALHDALRAVVHEPGGTAYYRRLRDVEVEVAGKTGTSQVVRIGEVRLRHEEKAYEHRDHALFAAFAPVDDPGIVVAVVHEHGGSGSRDAAPAGMAVIRGFLELQAQDAAERAHGLPPPPTEPAPRPRPRRRAPAPETGPPAPEGPRHAAETEGGPLPINRPPPSVTRG